MKIRLQQRPYWNNCKWFRVKIVYFIFCVGAADWRGGFWYGWLQDLGESGSWIPSYWLFTDHNFTPVGYGVDVCCTTSCILLTVWWGSFCLCTCVERWRIVMWPACRRNWETLQTRIWSSCEFDLLVWNVSTVRGSWFHVCLLWHSNLNKNTITSVTDTESSIAETLRGLTTLCVNFVCVCYYQVLRHTYSICLLSINLQEPDGHFDCYFWCNGVLHDGCKTV